MWTNHERRSAQQKLLELRGAEYILPLVVRPAELPGLPSTIGYLSLAERAVEDVIELLLKRLAAN